MSVKMTEGEFISNYMVLLECLSNDIKKYFGVYYSDHALVRLCNDLEESLLQGGDNHE